MRPDRIVRSRRVVTARGTRAASVHIRNEKIIGALDFDDVPPDCPIDDAATIIYAVGWTQHTSGTQIIRAAAMLQLLLGNIGRAGGGVNALRGHSNIQGATDMAGIFDILPGYLKVPLPTSRSIRRRRITWGRSS